MARLNMYDRPIEAELDGELGNRIIESAPQVERRSGLTLAEFDAEHRNLNRPVVLTGTGPQWPAWKKWTMDFFRQNYGEREVLTAVYSKSPQKARMAEVIDKIVTYDPAREKVPPYLQEWPIDVEAPELLKDFSVPEYFQRNWMAEKIGIQATKVWIGPRGATTPLHQDIASVQTWNAQISGKKLWILFGPKSYPLESTGKMTCDDFLKNPFTQARFYISAPGEILFVPKGWWHRVKTLETSINLSGHILDEEDVPKLVKQIMISDCLGWLNSARLAQTDPGMYETYRMRARMRAKSLGLDPNDILGIDKAESVNNITDLVLNTKSAEVTNA